MEDVDRPRVVAGSADRILRRSRHSASSGMARCSGNPTATRPTLQPSRTCTGAASPSLVRAAVSISPPRLVIRAIAETALDSRTLHWRSACGSSPATCSSWIASKAPSAKTYRPPAAISSSKRRDGWFAYLLAVVVDDAYQGVTHIVRGADLLDHTAAQIYLQKQLGLPSPAYAHVPALVEPDGGKLSKSARSVPLDPKAALQQLLYVFELLGLAPPPSLHGAPLAAAWNWAVERWERPEHARAGHTDFGSPVGGPRTRGLLLQTRLKRSLALTLRCAIL